MEVASPQPGLGELSPTEFASAVTAITSAFGDPTRREIYLFAHESDTGVTAADTARHFDLHANVARHHLDKLAAGGHLEIDLAKSSGNVGRPSKRYRATSPHVQLEVSIRHDDILVSLLGKALALLPPDTAEQMAEDVGLEYGKAMAAAIDPTETHRSYQGALHAVADALSAHGFAARAETTDDDTHPSPKDRFRLGKRIATQGVAQKTGAAWELFDDPEALKLEMHSMIVDSIAEEYDGIQA